MELIVNLFGAIFTAAFGVWAFFKPHATAKLVGLVPKGKRGYSEIKAIYGGLNISLGSFVAWSQTPEVFQMLAIGYFGAAFCRSLSLWMDNAFSRVGIRFIVVEIVLGLCLII